MAHSAAKRNRQRQKRKLAKQAQKAARQAIWDAMKGTGKNKKKKVSRAEGHASGKPSRILMEVFVLVLGKPGKGLRKVHGGGECRNIGCKRCSSVWKI